MKTAGQILQASRISKKFELDDVTRITKIRPHFLQAIESDNYSVLPSGATTRGFIRNYSEFLNLNPRQILAVFRRDFAENKSGQIVPRSMAQPAAPISFWTPKTTIIAAVTLVFIFFAAYLSYQFRILTGPPSLTVTSPPSEFVTDQNSVEIIGQTSPEATISINGELIALEKGGLFSVRIPLHPGLNQILITASSKSGKRSQITRQVTLTTPN